MSSVPSSHMRSKKGKTVSWMRPSRTQLNGSSSYGLQKSMVLLTYLGSISMYLSKSPWNGIKLGIDSYQSMRYEGCGMNW